MSSHWEDVPAEAWTTDPTRPGLYWIRLHNDKDGLCADPQLAILTPCGPLPKYALWAATPGLPAGHPGAYNYFVQDGFPRVEYAPYIETIVVRDDDGKERYRPVFFEIGERVVEEKG